MGQEKLAAKIFDSVVKRYDNFLRFATFGLIDKWQEALVKNTPAGSVALDVGTGTGEVLKKVSQQYPDCKQVGLDVAFNMLKKAKEKNPSSLLVKGSAYNLPFKDSSISSIYMSLVFRHLEPEEGLQEFRRVLEKGGHIGILDISKPHKLIFDSIYFFANKLFRPFGTRIFSNEEYDYFMHSIVNSKSPEELKKLMGRFGFKQTFIKKFLFGMVVVAVFKKT
ncbi:MAG: class I SAM-dependent methyltransferase [Aquificae bacterium]|nr:class I SAM-dependent methyltransferase [Aquificota bacterium]